jgi:hypothetical protein
MNQSLKKVGASRQKMFGPRGILVCGFSTDHRKAILKMFGDKKFNKISVIFTGEKDSDTLLKNIFGRDHQTGMEETCGLAPAIIMSGLTEQELHYTMTTYKKTGLPRPLWATLTPTSQNWTVTALVDELNSERLHFEK